MISVIPKIVVELRADADVAAIVAVNPTADPPRVRGWEPTPGWVSKPYCAFIIVSMLDAPRHPRLPIQDPRLLIKSYGRDLVEAWALYMAASDALHGVGPRIHTNGLGIYVSYDDTGGTQDKDPTTQQPFVSFVATARATTQAVTA